jgi:uncharacterized protein (DUF952 family)
VSDPIFHLTSRSSWSVAQKAGAYSADSLASDGFIHCSRAEQVLRVAEAFFAGQRGLALLVIDPGRLNAELRWEPGTDLPTESFPHVYGPINLDAVVEVLDFEPGKDGKFHLPPTSISH